MDILGQLCRWRLIDPRQPAIAPLAILGRFLIALLAAAIVPSTLSGATIRGQVVTEKKEPISRVSVTLEARGSGVAMPDEVATTTDENGWFRFEDVQPGDYRILAEKNRWVGTEQRVHVSDKDAQGQVEVQIIMKLTMLTKVLAHFQVGILVYGMLFGVLVLAFNMWVVPEPSKEIAAVGWIFIALSVVIACIKMLWGQAVLLALIGGASGWLIRRFGGKAAAQRVRQIHQEREQQAAEQKRHQEKLAELVGKEGTTLTDLKACGSASIEGEIVEVRAMEGFIAKGTRVVVHMLDGRTPVVEARQPSEAPAGPGDA